jgi:hypothetical protein
VRGPAASDRKREKGKTGLRGELGRSGRKGRELGRRPSLFAGWKMRESWREGFGFGFFNSFSFKTFSTFKTSKHFPTFQSFKQTLKLLKLHTSNISHALRNMMHKHLLPLKLFKMVFKYLRA